MPDKDSVLRRPPKQDRSRGRVDESLGAAKRLIGDKGIDAVTMREIAAATGGPISSIYQYFPNKSAIIATIYSQWSDELFDRLGEALASVENLDELLAAAMAMLDFYYHRVESDPAILDLINAIQADKALKNIDITETKLQAELFCAVARPWIPEERFEAFGRVAFLMFQLANGAVRLALSAEPDEAEKILADYKLIIRVQLNDFARVSAVGG